MTIPNNSLPKQDMIGIISIYKQAVKNLPILRYSWILIATICVLAFAAYFKLKNSDVFFYALLVIVISFLGFLFSYLLKTKEKFVKVLLYLLLLALVFTLVTAILAFGTFIIWEKPKFYNRWFPNQSSTNAEDNTINKSVDSTKVFRKDIKGNSAIDTFGKIQEEIAKQKDSLPAILSKGSWRPTAYIIPKRKNLKLAQFELYGIESAYVKDVQFFAAIGPKEFTTYSLDPYYNQIGHSLDPTPIFNVVLENTSDREILITKTLYRVSKVGQVMGGDYGLLEPKTRYEHILEWKTGDQEFSLVPPFRIGPHSSGDFLIQLKTNEKNIGLCWLMKIYFITSNEEGGVSTETFQLIMTGPYKSR